MSLASLVGAAVLPVAILALYREPQSPVFIASVIIAAVRVLDAPREHRATAARRGAKFVKKESAA